MKVAITGSSGYLGQLLLRRLSQDPEVDRILALDVTPSRFESPKLVEQFADVRTADFARSFRGIETVYHLAFVVEPRRGMSMHTIDEINIAGSRRVLSGALAAGVPRLICASSVAAYGAHPDNPALLTEESPLRPNPNWYYSRTKGHVERLLDRMRAEHPERILIRFRPCIFLGATTHNLMSTIFSAPVSIVARPQMRVDLCWDQDVAEAFHLGLRYPQSDIFNLAADHPLSQIEYAALAGRRTIRVSTGLFRRAAALAHRTGLVTRGHWEWAWAVTEGTIRVSAERARQRLGWSPRYDAAQTLLAFLRSRQSNQG